MNNIKKIIIITGVVLGLGSGFYITQFGDFVSPFPIRIPTNIEAISGLKSEDPEAFQRVEWLIEWNKRLATDEDTRIFGIYCGKIADKAIIDKLILLGYIKKIQRPGYDWSSCIFEQKLINDFNNLEIFIKNIKPRSVVLTATSTL